MFKLTSKLALSNLVKNRSLYYPFVLSTIVATAILYSFISLTYSSNMETTYGGTAARMTLQFGIWVIQIAVLILVTYANSFVMKNRSKELGIYSILGMEKRHLLTMTFIELCLLYTGVVGLGIICGMLLDKLLYALLLNSFGRHSHGSCLLYSLDSYKACCSHCQFLSCGPHGCCSNLFAL